MSAVTVSLLDYAENLARVRGQRWTPMRADVYTQLLAEGNPATAYQLIDRLSKQHDRDIKPASVYRALEALCALGLVVRIESLNAFRACRHPQEDHQHVFLVCDGCGHTDEIADHGIAHRLTADAAHRGFAAVRQVLELHGACRGCQTEGAA